MERFIYLNILNIVYVINIMVIKMVSITLAVTDELKHKMDSFPEINWSAVARQAIKHKIVFLEKMNELFGKSELTEEEAIELGRKVTKKVMKKLKG